MNQEVNIALIKKDVDNLRSEWASDKATRKGIPDLIDLKIEDNNELQDARLGKKFAELSTTLLEIENRLGSKIDNSLRDALTRSEKHIHEKYDDKVDKSFKVAAFLTSIWAGVTGLCIVGGVVLAAVEIAVVKQGNHSNQTISEAQ
jgi:hypothetical protein